MKTTPDPHINRCRDYLPNFSFTPALKFFFPGGSLLSRHKCVTDLPPTSFLGNWTHPVDANSDMSDFVELGAFRCLANLM